MAEKKQSERADQGLPGQGGHNREDVEPQTPTHRKDADGGDEQAGGESGEGSQSTGHPDNAG
jgi:hypothetical protein